MPGGAGLLGCLWSHGQLSPVLLCTQSNGREHTLAVLQQGDTMSWLNEPLHSFYVVSRYQRMLLSIIRMAGHTFELAHSLPQLKALLLLYMHIYISTKSTNVCTVSSAQHELNPRQLFVDLLRCLWRRRSLFSHPATSSCILHISLRALFISVLEKRLFI